MSGKEFDDGWTKVSRGKRDAPKHVSTLAQPMKDLAIGHLRTDFETKSKQWGGSTCRRAILNILDKQQPEEGWQLTEAVCLATNSFSRDNWQARQRSMMQWVAFFDITKHLQSLQKGHVQIYAQEPNYTPLDREFLARLKVQVLDAAVETASKDGLGEAEQHITPSAFVFEAFMDLSSRSVQQLSQGDPALYVGSSVERWLSTSGFDARAKANSVQGLKLKQDLPTGAQPTPASLDFVATRGNYRMPRFEEDPNIFEGLHIYWKMLVDEA
ncbi:hypothetical protein LTR10_002437 [Elasticomyces elasticus]|nr:hypothetical protein LTR10_002437 [Elasticomyces elasticus]KAK4973497.1 hypothetical protein LTR42_005485 [Elasticomyces elasticus]KAK5727422.1 hypothetical protein LTR15_003318 [Elasticomyces elasticus]